MEEPGRIQIALEIVQIAIDLLRQLLRLHDPVRQGFEHRHREWFAEEEERFAPDRVLESFVRVRHAPRHDHDVDVDRRSLDLGEEVETGKPGQRDIHDREVDRLASQDRQPCLSARRFQDIEPRLEHSAGHVTHSRLVVDDQDLAPLSGSRRRRGFHRHALVPG